MTGYYCLKNNLSMPYSPPILDIFDCPFTVIIICFLAYICYYLNSKNIPVESVSIHGNSIINNKEYWRIITGSYSHYSIMHLIFNCASAWSMKGLEKFLGFSRYLYYISILSIFPPILAVLISKTFFPEKESHAVGFSAVMFGMMTFMSTLTQSINLFGLTIPWSIMPFVSCLMTQIMIPTSSFTGHISGVVIGFLIRWHIFDFIEERLFWNLFPWVVFMFFVLYTKDHRESITWFSVSKEAPEPQTTLVNGVLVPLQREEFNE